jgi:protein phosphatase-4 regulatory subunit 3
VGLISIADDPDFPTHKANHRQYLSDESKYKEVVRIEDPNVRKKIHHTYRLQYLKDVVLARILDDPTFSVLNSLIFFNQVDIVQHLQANAAFLKDLFGVFGPQEPDQQRKKNAVHFIQQCCAIAKNLQAPARAQLYTNFIQNGLFHVINFALRHPDASVRIAGTDVLVAMIDHDPTMMRAFIFKQINEKQTPLTDTLIELLLVEIDLGVKAQIADAIKVLLDPQSTSPPVEGLAKASSDSLSFSMKSRGSGYANPETELFLQSFYDESAKKLFKPLKDLKERQSSTYRPP